MEKHIKTALLKNLCDKNLSDTDKMVALGNNTGNLVFWESIERLFNPEIIPYKESYRLQDYDNIIITDLIWIREKSDYTYLEKIVDKYDIPFIPISIGLQSPNFNPNFKLNSNLVRLLKKLESRAVLGVRGYYTADILQKHGITNFSVIGCPSMYYWKNPDLKISEAEMPKKISCNFRTFYGSLSKLEKHFLSYCAYGQYQFIEQTEHKLTLEQTHDEKYFGYVNKWLESSLACFYDYRSWSKGLKDIDFSIGGRFHGNVIALQNNVKSLFITCDSRTQEMVDLFALPSIRMSQFDKRKPIEYYFQLADYSKFNAKYPLLYDNFIDFVDRNNIAFNELSESLDFVSKKGNPKEGNVDRLNKLETISFYENNIIEIKLSKKDNRISYKLDIRGNWLACFFENQEFFVEFDQDIEMCPDSIAIIPALATVLPVSWVENATIVVDDIDEDFFECIDNVKENYKFMMPNIKFEGKLIAKKITRNNVNHVNHKVLCLFSGGVDATFTLLHNINYKPTILTIWGTDIYMDNVDAWNKVEKQNQKIADDFNIPFTSVKSSFREILNESYLTAKYGKIVNGNWWHDFEHGMALLGMVSPYAYLNNFSDVKIASSRSSKEKDQYLCASLPHLDENIRYCGCTIYHDGYYMSRNDKIKYIVDYNKKFGGGVYLS